MGLRRTDQLLFSFACFLVKSNLQACLAFIFVFSMEQTLRFVLLSITTEEKTSRFVVEKTLPAPNMWSKQSVSCSDDTYFSVLLSAHSDDPTCRQTLKHNLLVEEPELVLNLHVFACKQHGLRLTIGEPEKKHDSRPVSKFVVSMKHSARLGSKKNFSLIHGSSEKSLSKKRSIAKESLSSAKDFLVFVYMCMPETRDAIIV